jgi:hypothetical protein
MHTGLVFWQVSGSLEIRHFVSVANPRMGGTRWALPNGREGRVPFPLSAAKTKLLGKSGEPILGATWVGPKRRSI